MPTSTFFNLPEEKREKLLRAIKDEFSRVPFEKVSINQIIHAADIPRGSFYQYFADKNDLLEYIFLGYRNKLVAHLKEWLQANSGDIFGMFYEILEFAIGFTMADSRNNFFQNLFADIKVNTEFYRKIVKTTREQRAFSELRPLINTEMLDIRAQEDFTNILGILFSVCKEAHAEVFLDLSDSQNIKQKYKNKLELLRRGFTKNKENC